LNNALVGNEGANRLTGLGGVDTLTGGGGNDTFVFQFPTDGVDAITDFTQGADVLEISAAGFGSSLTTGGAVTVINAASAASTSNPGTTGYFIFDNAGADAGTVLWDATGGSGADAVPLVTLSGIGSLLPSDFLVV
jgi:Ca2+-binding RTX toxin-like protein